MKAYAINYTLRNKKANAYAQLAEAIQKASNGNRLHCLDSFWIITSEHSARGILERLAPFIQQDDHVMVHEMGRDYICYLSQESVDWLKKILG